MSSVLTAKKRIEEIDVLRGFAICMVILGHAIIEFPVNISQVPWCNWLHYAIYSFHMPLFFIVSGFVYKCRSYGKYILGKSSRIILPYAVFGIFSILLHIFAPSITNGDETPKDALIRFLVYGGDYWFLYALFIIFAIFPLLTKILKKDWMLIAFSAALILLQCFVKITEVATLHHVVYYLPWFTAGYICSNHRNSIKNILSKNNILILVVSIIISAAVIILCKKFNAQLMVFRYLRAIFPIVGLTVLSNILVRKAQTGTSVKIIKKFFDKCSAFSLQFYLFNGYFLTVLRLVICKILKITAPSIIVVSITIITIAGSIIICEILQRIPFISNLCGLTYKRRSE